MAFFKRSRFLYWYIKEFSKKYKKSIISGLGIGTIVFILFWYFAPTVAVSMFMPIERIGVVGQYTPGTIPINIQNDISYGLTRISEDGSAISGLASDWEATDSGKTYIFKLKNNITWHNGDPVTARDVNYNIRDVTFEVIDDYTLVARLQDPYSPFPTLLARPIFRKGLLGFGDYKVINLQLKGDVIKYLKLSPLDDRKLVREYRFYPTEETAYTAFKLGEVDKIYDIYNVDNIKSYKGANIERVIKYDRIVSLFFNTLNSKFADKSIRQSLAYLLPQNYPGVKAFSPLSLKSWGYTDKVKHFTEEGANSAIETLKNSTLASPSSEITLSTFPSYEKVANEIAKNWTDAGVKTVVKVENSLSSDYQILLSAQTIPPDPDQYPFWHSTQTEANITGFTSVKIDKLLEDARRELVQSQRKKIYADFQRYLVEEAPAVFLYFPESFNIVRDNQ